MELYRTPAERQRFFPLEAVFLRLARTDGFQYGAILRDISAETRSHCRIRVFVGRSTVRLDGPRQCNTWRLRRGAMICEAGRSLGEYSGSGDAVSTSQQYHTT